MTGKASESGAPKTIFSFWAQGRDHAPDIVKLCLDRWQQLNPDYELRVLDKRDYYEVLHDFPIDPGLMTLQAGSDALRARLLAQKGGIWIDASLLPVIPLEEWLKDTSQGAGFFAFIHPEKKGLIASWFLLCNAESYIMRQWLQRVEAYWYKPREPSSDPLGRKVMTFDPSLEISKSAGEADDSFPYFWFHFLLRDLIISDEKFRQTWKLMPKISKVPATQLNRLIQQTPNATQKEICHVARQAPVQKLDWRQQYPLDILADL